MKQLYIILLTFSVLISCKKETLSTSATALTSSNIAVKPPVFTGRQQIITLPTGGVPATSQALVWLPYVYSVANSGKDNKSAKPSKKDRFPLIIFLGGRGQQGSNINLLLVDETLPERISEGFNASAQNPVDGKTYNFIVVSPQGPAGSWGWQCVPHLKTMLPAIEAMYPVDTERVYVTGMSCGGWGTWSCITDDTEFCKKLAAIAPVSSAPADKPDLVTNAGKYGVAVWSICGTQDGFYSNSVDYTNRINAANPVIPAKLTGLPGVGHNAWVYAYNPEWRDGGLNLFEWMLQYKRKSK